VKFADRIGKRVTSSRGYHTAIVTSFAVDFNGFEQVILPQLIAAGASNILLIADDRMSGLALSEDSILPRQLGRDYALLGPAQSRGVFHPKIVLQLGRDGGRAFVGSANATASGIGGNLEIVTEVACTKDASPERDFVLAVWAYIRRIVGQSEGAPSDAIRWARDRTPWLDTKAPVSPVDLPDGSRLGFFAAPDIASIADQFASEITESVERLIMISPYWDADLRALADLAARLGHPRTQVLLDISAHEFPVSAPRPDHVEVLDASDFHKNRFKHAKLIIAQTAQNDHILTGSANCTVAAMGTRGFVGVNAEASVYRRVDRDVAISHLGLGQILQGVSVSPDDMALPHRSAPIPLEQAQALSPGRFETDNHELRWMPGARGWTGRLQLLDIQRAELGDVPIVDMTADGSTLVMRCEGLEAVSFVCVDDGTQRSNLAPLIHRGQLKARRREAATPNIARAIARFADSNDLQLVLLQYLEELARADAAEIKLPSHTQSVVRRPADSSDDEPKILSYDQFIAQSPNKRAARGGESSTTGSHVDIVRTMLNRLAGIGRDGQATVADNSDDWMDLGDEGAVGSAEREPPAQHEKIRPAIDRADFVGKVQAYVKAMTSAQSPKPVTSADVMFLRFWVMLILHSAQHQGQDGGLPCTVDDFGWPRLIVRILSAFFFGPKAPILRLILEGSYQDMPVDFLEAWATALWALDLVQAILPSNQRTKQFHSPLPLLRRAIVMRTGLSQYEIDGSVAVVRAGLDQAFGHKLR
jgi:hypothetical protein